MFAGSCIGVVVLVLSLEFLRRLGKEYDRYLARQFRQQRASRLRSSDASEEASNGPSSPDRKPHHPRLAQEVNSCHPSDHFMGPGNRHLVATPSKPNFMQQLIRALLHMLQFGVAYFIMLLAMYYNGYIIICILIGAFLGAFVFSWESIGTEQGSQEDPTMCCG